MIIGCDIDGCLADFNQAYLNTVIKTSGRDLFPPRPFDFPTWYWPEHFGYTAEEVLAAWDKIRKSYIFWALLEAYPDTAYFLDRVKHLGQPTYFITDRSGPNPKEQTERWLSIHFSSPTVLISKEKGLCCKALKISHYIDDKDENCMDVKLASSGTKVFMLKRSWNHELEGIPRLDSIVDFLEIVKDAC